MSDLYANLLTASVDNGGRPSRKTHLLCSSSTRRSTPRVCRGLAVRMGCESIQCFCHHTGCHEGGCMAQYITPYSVQVRELQFCSSVLIGLGSAREYRTRSLAVVRCFQAAVRAVMWRLPHLGSEPDEGKTHEQLHASCYAASSAVPTLPHTCPFAPPPLISTVAVDIYFQPCDLPLRIHYLAAPTNPTH